MLPTAGFISDYHMALAPQVLQIDEYRGFYRDVAGHVILDNGAAEGGMVDNADLFELAHEIDADEVIAPDVMYDTERTMNLLGPFCEEAHARGVKVMAVLQANNWVEFHDMLEAALAWNVAALALPKLLCSTLGAHARTVAAERIQRNTHLPIHCLGASRDIRHETKALARQGIVRGLDTSAPCVLGLQEQPLNDARYDWQMSHSAIIDYWHQPSNGQVEANLGLFKEWCDG
jgi:hypothetical protein